MRIIFVFILFLSSCLWAYEPRDLQGLDLSTLTGMERARLIFRDLMRNPDTRIRQEALVEVERIIGAGRLYQMEWPVSPEDLFGALRDRSLRLDALNVISRLYDRPEGLYQARWRIPTEAFQAVRALIENGREAFANEAVELLITHLQGSTFYNARERAQQMQSLRSIPLSAEQERNLLQALRSLDHNFQLFAVNLSMSRAADRRPFRRPNRILNAIFQLLNQPGLDRSAPNLRLAASNAVVNFIRQYPELFTPSRVENFLTIARNERNGLMVAAFLGIIPELLMHSVGSLRHSQSIDRFIRRSLHSHDADISEAAARSIFLLPRDLAMGFYDDDTIVRLAEISASWRSAPNDALDGLSQLLNGVYIRPELRRRLQGFMEYAGLNFTLNALSQTIRSCLEKSDEGN